MTTHRNIFSFLAAVLVAISVSACGRADKSEGPQGPTIEANPVQQREGQWTIVSSDLLKLTVTAPGAQRVRLLYRPVVAEGRQAVLKTLTAPTDAASGKFSVELKPAPDFAGHVWAEVSYPDKTKKKTEALALAAESALSPQSGQIPLDSIGGSAGTDESARSDRITGGSIKQAQLKEGEGGMLHLYPDVYGRGGSTVESLRAELWESGVEESALDDQTLKQMMSRVSMAKEFVASIADLKAGRALTAGRDQPLTDYSVEKGAGAKRSRRSSGGR